ncbi:MAG: hypothetical protein K0R18_1806 [Bacillales bacterium]|jgi:hypothetical protein|nr:hypothetical protein [Bacillales bacterium]
MKKSLRSLVVLIFIVLVTLGLVSGCGSKDKTSRPESKKMIGENVYSDTDKQKGYTASDQNQSKNTVSKEDITNNRKIIKNAKLDVETKKYADSLKQLESLVNQFNGYIENSNVNGGDSNSNKQSRSASYTVRIPADQLESFLSSMGTIGKITQKSTTGQDVTQQYFDKESRLTALKIEQASLEDFLKKSTTVKDTLEIYKELTNVNTEIEQLTGEVQKLDQLVSLSKVDITVNEVPEAKVYNDGSFMSELKNVFVDSCRALLSLCGGIIKAVIATAPFALVFGVVAFIGYFIFKKIKTRINKL